MLIGLKFVYFVVGDLSENSGLLSEFDQKVWAKRFLFYQCLVKVLDFVTLEFKNHDKAEK